MRSYTSGGTAPITLSTSDLPRAASLLGLPARRCVARLKILGGRGSYADVLMTKREAEAIHRWLGRLLEELS